jgi:palmitoyltransferase
LQEVITWTCIPSGDGIEWSLREDSDCNKYTLTIEQLEQKAEKRLRTREYKIAKVYSGSWLPFWSMG